MRYLSIFFAALLCLGSLSCRKEQGPATVPASQGEVPRLAELRTEMLRLVGDPPVGGRLPESPTWSPSGSVLGFLRVPSLPGKGKELWLHEIAGHTERPVPGGQGKVGIDSFCFVSETQILALTDGELVLLSTMGEPPKILTSSNGKVGDFACGGFEDRVAFSLDGDIYVLKIDSGVETRLTNDATADRVHGEVPWLYREELNYGPGLLWSSDGRKLLWLTTDLEGVRRAKVWKTNGKVSEEGYPLPGERLPRAHLTAATFNEDGVAQTARFNTGEASDTYLVRPVWHPSGKQMLVWRLDRLQTLLELMSCDAKGACTVLSEHRDPRFLEPPSAVVIPGQGEELLVLSSASGSHHIHVLSREGLHLRQLTSGSFEVDSIDAVDLRKGLVYFTGNVESTAEHLLYCVPLRGGRVRRVSETGGHHATVWSTDAARYAGLSSDVDRPPRLIVRGVDEEKGFAVMGQELSTYAPPDATTDFFTLETQAGHVLHASLTRPKVLSASKRYPVLLYVYGGPGIQITTRRWNRKMSAWRDFLAQRGVLVFSLDGRGAKGYGRDNAVAIHTRLLEPEVADQIAGLTYLVRQPHIDPARIGVFGWSYGGSMALTLATHPEAGKQLRAAVAVAPVTDFARYDATYTERYLQRPEDNPEGYARTDLTARAGNLRAPLLLVHGIADDNVHFEHSARMLRAFMDAGRPVETAFYPDESHGLRGKGVLVDVFSRITDFLLRNL